MYISVSVDTQGYLPSWDVFWDLTSNLIISGCDSTLTVLGMSAVISSVAHYLGLSILAFIGTSPTCGPMRRCGARLESHVSCLSQGRRRRRTSVWVSWLLFCSSSWLCRPV